MNYLLNYDVKHKWYFVKRLVISSISEFNNQQIFPKSSYGSFLRKASDIMSTNENSSRNLNRLANRALVK